MHKKNFFLSGLINAVLIIFLSSCEETMTDVGSALLPDSDGIEIHIDTLTDLRFTTVITDSLLTSDMSNPMVGDITHSFFGKTKIVYISQFLYRYPTYNDQAEITGGNLVLAIDTIFGYKNTSSLRFSLYELKNDPSNGLFGINDTNRYFSIDLDTDYYQKNLLNSIDISLRNLDSDGNMSIIKIPLPNRYISRLKRFQDSIFDVPDYYSYNEDSIIEREYSKIDSVFAFEIGAIAIEAEALDGFDDNPRGAIVRINAASSLTRIDVNYTFPGTSNNEPTEGVFKYLLNPRAAFNDGKYRSITNYCTYINNFEGYPISNHLDIENDTLGFIHSLAGLRTQIEISELGELLDKYDKVVINKAELTLEDFSYPGITGMHMPSDYVWLSDNNSFEAERADEYYVLQEYVYSKTGDDPTVYSFNIPHLITDYINDNNDNLIYMHSAYPKFDRGRFVYSIIDGFRYNFKIFDQKSARLVITYTIP